jgi:hypothetical protein
MLHRPLPRSYIHLERLTSYPKRQLLNNKNNNNKTGSKVRVAQGGLSLCVSCPIINHIQVRFLSHIHIQTMIICHQVMSFPLPNRQNSSQVQEQNNGKSEEEDEEEKTLQYSMPFPSR